MKIAVLEVDDEAVRLVGDLVNSEGAALVCISATSNQAAINRWQSADLGQSGEVQQLDHWESLLVVDADSVVVAPAQQPADLEDPLKKLVQGAVPLVVIHPLCDALLAYELAMIARESGGRLLPYFPGCGHPAIARLAEWVRLADSSPLGSIEEIVLERQLGSRAVDDVSKWLPRDVHFITSLIGRITSVSAVGSRDESNYDRLSIHFAGALDVGARWSLSASSDERGSRMVVSGRKGRATLTMPADQADWTLTVSGDTPSTLQFSDWDEAAALLGLINSEETADLGWPSWDAICRDLDVCDYVERSFRRKRTVEVRDDDRSEVGAFKGIMAAAGCGLLMLALGGLLIGAVVEGLRMPFLDDRTTASAEDAPARFPLLIRLWPVYPLLLFLALQLLLLVAKPASQQTASPADSRSET